MIQNLVSSISELQFIVKSYPDTIELKECPHCKGKGSFGYLIANIWTTEPCAGCDGIGEVYDGIRQTENGFDVRVAGMEYSASTPEEAALIYNEQQEWLARLGEEIPW